MFNHPLYLNLPKNPIGWISWCLVLLIIFYLGWLIQRRGLNFDRSKLIWLASLSLFLLISSTFLYFKIDLNILLGESAPVVILPLSMLSWLLAAGFLGVLPSLGFALASGLLIAVMHSHSIITPLFFLCISVCFNLFVGTVKSEKIQEPMRSPFSAVLLTSLVALLLLLGMVIFSASGNFVIQISKCWHTFQVNFLTFIPVLLFDGLVTQALSKAFSEYWHPQTFQKLRVSTNPLHQATGVIQTLSEGNYFEPIPIAKSFRKSNELYNVLEKLRASLESQKQIQSKLAGLENLELTNISSESLFAMILRAALRMGGSSARMILFSMSPGQSSIEMNTRVGTGPKSKHYAYLDEVVIQKLASKNQLMLSDIKPNELLSFNSNMLAPKSLAAFSLENREQKLGVLWIAFEDKRWLSDEEQTYYQTLVQRTTIAVTQADLIKKSELDQSLFANLLNAISDPILGVQEDGRIIFANNAAKAMLALENSVIEGQLLANVFPEDIIKTIMDNFGEGTTNKLITFPNGKEAFVSIQKNNEQNLQNTCLIHIRDANLDRNTNQQQSEFVSNVSHDLRTPLILMKGYISMLKNIGNLNDQQQMYIQRILTNLESMNNLVNNVLNLERMDSDISLQTSTFSLNDIIHNSVLNVELPALQKKINIIEDYGGLQNILVNGDQILLQQAFLNLLDNAIKFSNIGGKVWVLVSRSGENLRIAIKDEGVGIAPLDQAKVFNRFYRTESNLDRNSGGYGLGLSIVRSVVEKHGGKVGVTSQLGRGSNFHIDLPETLLVRWE